MLTKHQILKYTPYLIFLFILSFYLITTPITGHKLLFFKKLPSSWVSIVDFIVPSTS
jgi:hypothetical protein